MSGYITVKEIQNELKVSRSRAYAIAHQCTRLIDGRSIRVSRASFEVWKRLRTEEPCPSPLSSSEAASGGAPSPTRKGEAAGSQRRPAATTTKPRSTSGEDWSENPFLRPIVPRTRPRSALPSKPDSTNVVPLAAGRGR